MFGFMVYIEDTYSYVQMKRFYDFDMKSECSLEWDFFIENELAFVSILIYFF